MEGGLTLHYIMNIEEAISEASAFGGCIFNNDLSFDRALSLSKKGPLSTIDSDDGFTGLEIISDNWDCYKYSETTKRADHNRGKGMSLYESLLKLKSGIDIYNPLGKYDEVTFDCGSIIVGPSLHYGSDQLGSDVFVYRYWYLPNGWKSYAVGYKDELAMFTAQEIYFKTWGSSWLYE